MKPKILVCGVKPRAAREVERAFEAYARLAFFYDQNPRQLGKTARSADMVFIQVDGVAHRATQQVRDAGAPYRLNRGATSTLIAEIAGYLGVPVPG